ncbi:MAG: VCBS repeat-containing protein [Planctomycetota bacterium]
MDLNGDGHTDILSGSYSRMESDMAGLYQVLYGQEGGGFAKAQVLNGTDGEPLIMDLPDDAAENQGGMPSGDSDLERICTRAWAVDLNGDGKLDLVSGNFGGTFGMFAGEGEGRFSPDSDVLRGADGAALQVEMHSDPTFVDWDGDGDPDMISGSTVGTITLFPNESKDGAVVFGEPVALVEIDGGHGDGSDELRFGIDHISGPSGSTRVAVADVNGDSKLDLLVGDTVSYVLLKDGVSEAEGLAALKAYDETMQELYSNWPEPENYDEMTPEEEAAMEAHGAKMEAAAEEKAKFVDDRMTGFVWLYTQE